MKTLTLLKDELEKCVRCGTCRSVCPTFGAIGRETASARGKLTLIRAYIEGGLGLSEEYLKHLRECTTCGACGQNCPSGVKTTAIFRAAKAEVVEKLGVPPAASLIFKGISGAGGLAPLALKMASRLQGLVFKSDAQSGLISRFPLPIIGNNRLVPNLARTFFLDLPEVKALGSPSGRGTARVAFYSGCGVNYLMPQVGTATINVLKRAGADVVVPQGQVCCGMPAYSMGDVASARTMAKKNLEVFESMGPDFIATSCATCGYGLKKMFMDLLGDDPAMRPRVEAFASKVRDITELLVNDLKYSPRGGAQPYKGKKATYHDPCHLGRNQGVREEPRELITAGGGLRLKEMKHPCACCGLGGGLSITNYELSMDIAGKKAESIKGSGAEIVATACPGCIVQIKDGLHRNNIDAKVVHVVELL